MARLPDTFDEGRIQVDYAPGVGREVQEPLLAALNQVIKVDVGGADISLERIRISSARDSHRWPSRHITGLAVDISRINGKFILANYRKDNVVTRLVDGLQNEFQQLSNELRRENFGPAMKTKNMNPNFTVGGHRDHIHFSCEGEHVKPQPPSPQRELIRFCFASFIPRDVDGFTRPVPRGEFKGDTMIAGPIPGISDCFLTDNRDFAKGLGESSRLRTEIAIRTNPLEVLFSIHKCDRTFEIDCEDGSVECEETSSTRDCRISDPTIVDNTLTIDFVASALNPCYPLTPDELVPAIDYLGTLAVDADARTIELKGKVDDFPAYEAFVVVNGGDPIVLVQRKPDSGKGPASLEGPAEIPVQNQVQY